MGEKFFERNNLVKNILFLPQNTHVKRYGFPETIPKVIGDSSLQAGKAALAVN